MKQPGDFIDRFRVERRLGEGGVTEGYQVRHRQLGTVHALKLLAQHRPGQRDRLMQEGRIQARLRHPNLVAVTDVVEADGRIGLVMEHVEGFSLADCLHEGGGMPLEDSLELFQQILEAVGTAHAAGVLHRDLTPRKILLTTTGDRVVARVTDFGVSARANGASTPGSSRSGPLMGTPGYRSPEQITGAATVDRRADIFALGAILYELLSGQKTFVGDSPREVLDNTSRGVYAPLDVHLPDTPRAVVDAIQRALQVSPEDRFPDTDSFADALALGFTLASPDAPVAPTPEPPTTHLHPTPLEDEEDPSTEVTDPGLAHAPSPPDWGLDDASISFDASIPKTDFEDVKKKIAEERERLARLDAARESDGESSEGAAGVRGFGSRVDRWLVRMIWPMVRAFGSTVKFVLGPGIALAVLTLWAGRQGAALVGQARGDLRMATTQLLTTLDAEEEMAAQVQDLGGRDTMLQPLRERYERATTDEERIEAARDLNDALLEELRLLPHTDDPEQALTRRNLELQLHELTRKHDAYDVAVDRFEEESATLFALVALTFDMVEAGEE